MLSDYRFQTHGLNALSEKPNEMGKFQTYKGAYISITNKCNTDVCSYCYARAEHKQKPMTIENFQKVIGWLSAISDFPEVYFVGGEPTVHPQLLTFLDILQQNNWTSTLYTNGAFGRRLCDQLKNHNALARIAFHSDALFYKNFKNYESNLLYNLENLSKIKETSLIFVIDNPEFDYNVSVNYAIQYGLSITWIFATPTVSNTPYFGLTTMRKLGPRVQEFLLCCLKNNIKTSPDLPIPLCIFDSDFLAAYGDTFSLIRKCRPFVYFKSDLSTQFCTALPTFSNDVPKDHVELLKHVQAFREVDSEMKKIPSFQECITCENHLNGTCQGGCMTYKNYNNPQLEL